VTYPGAFASDGTYSIPSVPVGPYWLVLVDGSGAVSAFETSASSVDLGYDLLGRPDVAFPASSTPVILNATWTGAAGDALQLTSSNADVHDLIEGAAFATLLSTGTVTEDWLASSSGVALHLLAAGDTLYVNDLAPGSFTSGSPAQSFGYRAALNATFLTGLITPAPITAAFGPAAQSGSLTVDWRTSAFEALAADMVSTSQVTSSAHTLVVGASAHPLANPSPRATEYPDLLRITVSGGTPDVAPLEGPLAYAQFLDGAIWNEWRAVGFTVHVSYTAPGATTPFDETASIAALEPMTPAPASPIVPTLTPVQAPLVGGAGAFASLTGVGLTPTLSWTAPAVGTPTSYTVTVYVLGLNAGASTSTPVATFTTTQPTVTILPGMLTSGNVYYARIVATVSPSDTSGTAPLRFTPVGAHAATLTGTFAP
jgi:hypothetical protein